VLLLFVLLVWPLAAFGGRSAAVAISCALASVLVALAVRARLGGELDWSVLACLAVVAGQTLPLPRHIVDVASPSAGHVRQALTLVGAPSSRVLPLSIDASSTLWALAVFGGAFAIFCLARAEFARGGVRMTTRLISGLGFAVSMLAIAQAATAGRKIYWRFPTEFEGPLPFGPFVNRNHFATWAIMALPLCIGYLAARGGGRPSADHVAARTRAARAIDSRSAWLIAAGVVMAIALLLSLSRSGALALGLSAVVTGVLGRRQLIGGRRRTAQTAIAIVVLLGLAWADIPAIRDRIAGAPTAVADRIVIWRETVPVLRDFWRVGTGSGTYQRAMYVYQRSERTVFFNQAHNHYLQVAAEGGILLVGALAFALVMFVRTARRRIAEEATALVWIRLGAACGLGAVALQSVWETGLTMPANAALAAVLAAIVVHEKERRAQGLPRPLSSSGDEAVRVEDRQHGMRGRAVPVAHIAWRREQVLAQKSGTIAEAPKPPPIGRGDADSRARPL
jgi:O-antigen ligase